jgi:hypothetical protein
VSAINWGPSEPANSGRIEVSNVMADERSRLPCLRLSLFVVWLFHRTQGRRNVAGTILVSKSKMSDVLYGAGDPMDYIYFPESAVISMVMSLSDGSSVETGLIG